MEPATIKSHLKSSRTTGDFFPSFLMRKTPLAKQGKSDVARCKRRIQALLREIVILRDGGCLLRRYPEAGRCGGYAPKTGNLVLQAEHLITRERNISYGDLRNIVALCARHHQFFKPQNSRLYWTLIHKAIGPERSAWLDRVEADRKSYPMGLWDWEKVELSLQKELENQRNQ